MASKKAVSKTKERVSQVITQAKASLKVLETLEKETLAKAKPLVSRGKSLSSEKLLTSLRKIGVATADDVENLVRRIEKLESQLALLSPRAEREETPASGIPQA